MSGRYLVMPRGINVGTRNRVPMAELRHKLAEAGCEDVATVLQSGNVIFTSEVESTGPVVEFFKKLLADEFDVAVECVARTADQFHAVLDKNPLKAEAVDPSRYLVNFFSDEPDAAAVKLLTDDDHSPEMLEIHGSEGYVWTPEGVKAMRLSYSFFEKKLGVTATARNWNTLEKIANKF